MDPVTLNLTLPAGNWTGGLFGSTYAVGDLGAITHVYRFGLKVPMDVEVFVVMVLPMILLIGGAYLFAYLWGKRKGGDRLAEALPDYSPFQLEEMERKRKAKEEQK